MKRIIFCFFLSSLVSLSMQTEDTDTTKDDSDANTLPSQFGDFNNTSSASQAKKEILPVRKF